MIDEWKSLQAVIGYDFKDKSLLICSFTHSSYVNEHDGIANERLEFVGDCVLNFLVGVRYYEQYKDVGEGKLSAMRSSVVSRAPLSRLVDRLGLMQYLRVGAGVDKSAFADKARSDIFEALLGAMYVDGGLDVCGAFLERVFFGSVSPERDYKSELQSFAAKRGASLVYKVDDGENGLFNAVATVNGASFAGTGKTKRAAEINAAKAAIDVLIDGND